mmetsp:Transcript_41577/g.43529  ORF Transcript_41577/g.43529 Transcript_41577/m.43529 type:complete len:83 (+) Transcript_41577:694-942(+)
MFKCMIISQLLPSPTKNIDMQEKATFFTRIIRNTNVIIKQQEIYIKFILLISFVTSPTVREDIALPKRKNVFIICIEDKETE